MALVNVVNMAVLDNPAPFLSPFSFEITFECLQPLPDDLEWRVLYVGSADDATHDQVLDEVLVGPVPAGANKFVLSADAPDIAKIPEGDVLGVTVVLVTCSYREKEFVRVGYYVNNEYTEPYDEERGPPSPLDVSKVRRAVLSERPRVTRFPIQWGDNKEDGLEQQGLQGQQEVNGAVENGFGERRLTQQQQQAMGDDAGMALDDMEGGDDDEEELEDFDDEDDVSVEGQDMMMDDIATGNSNTAISAE